MPNIAGALPLALIVLVGVCAPVAGWLAMQRARNPMVWFVYGVLIGPLAPLLLAAAPMGRCYGCATLVAGWSGTCSKCDAPLGGWFGRVATDAPTRSVGPQPATASDGAGVDLRRSATLPSTVRPIPSIEPIRTSSGEVLATAVYLSGNAGLEVGARYAIARVVDRISIHGPVDTGQQIIRHEGLIDDAEVVALDDRLSITLRQGRASTSMIMRWAGGMAPPNVAAELAAGSREGQSTVRVAQ